MVRARLASLAEERGKLRGDLAGTGSVLTAGAALLQTTRDLLERPQELFRQTTDPARR